MPHYPCLLPPKATRSDAGAKRIKDGGGGRETKRTAFTHIVNSIGYIDVACVRMDAKAVEVSLGGSYPKHWIEGGLRFHLHAVYIFVEKIEGVARWVKA